MSNDEDEVARLLVRLINISNRLGRYAAHATGERTSPATWRALSVLQEKGPLRLGVLAENCRVRQPTMTAIVESLLSSGYVLRRPDPDDRRAQLHELTAAGEAALEDWRSRVGAALTPLFDDLTEDEHALLSDSVRLLDGRLRRGEA
ncbi:MarR family winged helix-turn-helix transcriptional regulator [Nocardiopsis aegyptia]|uniref:DNA-binding MarR family transcriptional regulator n=1 Tax=Nocardiopsis aegyptia TaxID=220378 RepID=A0A7Z0EIV0_9ACTN|nr:MarR family transcriptional regulator [Nocardiopsis aegyptia]NYJ32772.1 DNA-binding MarR family transcriptional regulator [Nocardiopsis aegyptia]